MGRARAVRLTPELLGAPSSPRSFERRRVGCKVVPKSTVLATRHEPPCPCTVTGCASGRSSLRASRHRAASPKMCRTESHRHASRPVVSPSRAACRRLTVRIGLDRRFEGNASSRKRDFAAKPSGGELRPPALAKPAPTAPLRSGGCHGLCLPPPTEKSVRRQSRPGAKESLASRRKQCLRASGGAHCRVARESERKYG